MDYTTSQQPEIQQDVIVNTPEKENSHTHKNIDEGKTKMQNKEQKNEEGGETTRGGEAQELLRQEEKRKRKEKKKRLRDIQAQFENDNDASESKKMRKDKDSNIESAYLPNHVQEAPIVTPSYHHEHEITNQTKMNEIHLNENESPYGRHFATSRETLLKDKDSIFNILLAEKKQHYVIDRDETHFRYILHYLREGCQMNIAIPSRENRYLLELKNECRFYKLEGLLQLVNTRLETY